MLLLQMKWIINYLTNNDNYHRLDLFTNVVVFYPQKELIMFTIGQKIELWMYRQETLQLVVDQRFMLTVTKILDDGEYMGVREDGAEYKCANGFWWAEKPETEPMRLESAVGAWTMLMLHTHENRRVILMPSEERIVPGGDVGHCTKHNHYFHTGGSCRSCRRDEHRASEAYKARARAEKV